MIGLLLITHGSLGEALIQCVSHVLNRRPPQLMQIGVTGQDDPTESLPLTRRLLHMVDSGDGVLILTDVLGATPSNMATKLLEPGRIEGIAGVNLPMLLRCLTYRERNMETLVKKAVAGACEGVVRIR